MQYNSSLHEAQNILYKCSPKLLMGGGGDLVYNQVQVLVRSMTLNFECFWHVTSALLFPMICPIYVDAYQPKLSLSHLS